MPAKRHCVPSAKVAVDPIAALDRRFHSPFKLRLLCDPDSRGTGPRCFTPCALTGSFVLARPCGAWRRRTVAGAATRVPDRPAGADAMRRTVRNIVLPPVMAADRPGPRNATMNVAEKALK